MSGAPSVGSLHRETGATTANSRRQIIAPEVEPKHFASAKSLKLYVEPLRVSEVLTPVKESVLLSDTLRV